MIREYAQSNLTERPKILASMKFPVLIIEVMVCAWSMLSAQDIGFNYPLRELHDQHGGEEYLLGLDSEDLELSCNKEENGFYVSGSTPESSKASLGKLVARGLSLLRLLGITNPDGTELRLDRIVLRERTFGKYKIWIASLLFTQDTSGKSDNPARPGPVVVSVPLDDIAILAKRRFDGARFRAGATDEGD